MTNLTRVFQPTPSWLNWRIAFNGPYLEHNYSLDSEDCLRSGCRNVGHQQQFFSELPSSGRSHNTSYCYSWVQPIYCALAIAIAIAIAISIIIIIITITITIIIIIIILSYYHYHYY